MTRIWKKKEKKHNAVTWYFLSSFFFTESRIHNTFSVVVTKMTLSAIGTLLSDRQRCAQVTFLFAQSLSSWPLLSRHAPLLTQSPQRCCTRSTRRICICGVMGATAMFVTFREPHFGKIRVTSEPAQSRDIT